MREILKECSQIGKMEELALLESTEKFIHSSRRESETMEPHANRWIDVMVEA